MTSSSHDQDQHAEAEQPVDEGATADCRDSHDTATGKHRHSKDFRSGCTRRRRFIFGFGLPVKGWKLGKGLKPPPQKIVLFSVLNATFRCIFDA